MREAWLHSHGRTRSHGGGVRDLAYRLSGSSDVFAPSGRGPLASVNFLTAHDGFTLHDLVSYDHKHNEANGEDNRDGSDHNHSWNCGVEGPTDDETVLALRRRLMRGLMTTLLVSTGVPMLTAGRRDGPDSAAATTTPTASTTSRPGCPGTTRRGSRTCSAWTQALVTLRREHRVLRHDDFFEGRPAHADGVKDIAWFCADGAEMTPERWFQHDLRVLGLYLSAADPAGGTRAEPGRCSSCSTPAGTTSRCGCPGRPGLPRTTCCWTPRRTCRPRA